MKVDAFSREVHKRLCALPTPKDPDPVGIVFAIADQVATEFQRTNPAAIQGFIAYCEAQARRTGRRKRRL